MRGTELSYWTEDVAFFKSKCQSKQPIALQRGKQATGSQMAVVEGGKVTLPLVHNLVMKIYHIILSPQHKCRSMSVTACQVGLSKTAPAADETALTAVCSKCADSGHRAPYGTAR